MNKKNGIMCKTLVVIGVLCVLGIYPIWAQAGESTVAKPVADEMVNASGITWIPKINYAQLVLRVSRPDGTVFTKTFSSGSSPYLDLASLVGNRAGDGSYNYELRAISTNLNRVRREGEIETSFMVKGANRANELVQSGHFLVQGGAIVTPTGMEVTAPDASKDGLSRTMDLCYQDDMVIQYSLCVGVDCVCNMNFGFDTIVLKENNLRIFFDDTSVSSGFPSNDWRIICNDSTSGGASYFSVEDATSSKRVFSIEAGAPTNSLNVNSGGKIGIGTSTPNANLHVYYCDTPTLRLDQSSACGWTPQAWDVAGNEANFFIRDVTHSGTLPFRIKTGAPTNSLFINSDGKIGLGNQAPTAPLHITSTISTVGDPGIYYLNNGTAPAEIQAEKSGGAKVYMSGAVNYGFFGTRTVHPLRFLVNGLYVMEINSSGNYINMTDGGYYDGTWHDKSSREVKENIENLNLDEAVNALEGLNPVKYNYITKKDEPRVGFIAEDVPDLVATNDRKALSPMDIVAVLTKVVQEQQKTIAELKKEISELKKNNNK